MDTIHLTSKRLQHLLERDSDAEADLLLLHHLDLCPECRQVGGFLLDFYRAGEIEVPFCTVEIDLARSRAAAPKLWEKLRSFPPEKQLGLVTDLARFRSWGLCELLCRMSEEIAPEDAAEARRLAELAVAVAMGLKEWQPVEERWLFELRGLAWAHLGNAERVCGNLREAVAAFTTADRWWESGYADAGDVLGFEARFLAMKASLLAAQERYTEALELLAQAELADEKRELTGAILMNRARILDNLGDVAHAIEVLRRAAVLVNDSQPRLLLCLRHNLVLFLTTAERYEEAEALLPDLAALTRSIGKSFDRIRFRWGEGRIAAGLGKKDEAIAALEEVRQAFTGQEIGYDSALVSLELAALYAEQGRATEVKALANEMLPIFTDNRVSGEVLAVLGVSARLRSVNSSRRTSPDVLRSSSGGRAPLLIFASRTLRETQTRRLRCGAAVGSRKHDRNGTRPPADCPRMA